MRYTRNLVKSDETCTIMLDWDSHQVILYKNGAAQVFDFKIPEDAKLSSRERIEQQWSADEDAGMKAREIIQQKWAEGFVNVERPRRELLEIEVVRQLKRLKIPIQDDLDLTFQSWPYFPEVEETALGEREVPAAILQFLYGYVWEGSPKFKGEDIGGWRDVWSLEFFDNIRMNYQESKQEHQTYERAYFLVGYYDGGNYSLMIDLDDDNPSNPMMFALDHDPDPDDDDPVYSFDCRLAEFLAVLKPDKPKN